MLKTYYYAWGHTAQGLVSFAESNLLDIERVYILNHPSEAIKTAIINQIIKQYDYRCNMEIIKSVNGDEFLDGVIIRDESLAVFTRPVSIENSTVIDLKSYTNSQEIENLFIKKHALSDESYQKFVLGLKVHDDLESIYINEMDFDKADQLTEKYIHMLVKSSPAEEGKGHVFHRFFGTNTKNGVVNVVPELIESVAKTYFIKGRAGTGKSTFMKRIANACTDQGFDVELYHCSFDSNSIDMVLVRELDFCIFDSTDPHEFFPEQETDEMIDLYKALVTPGTDEKYEAEIGKLNNQYKSYMKKGIEHLEEAGKYQSQIEAIFKSVHQTEMNIVIESISTRVL